MEKTNECKYCGELNNSPDEDLLCEKCRTDFGHTFFHEL